MKRISLSFLYFFLFSALLFAENVSQERAQQMALAFWQSSPQTRGASAVSLQMVLQSENLVTRATTGSASAYYVFDNTSGPGFVIVAGDDAVMPVLAYSFDQEFSTDELPLNLRDWLLDMRAEINYVREHRLPTPESVRRAWNAPRTGSEPVVKIETALWDQSSPYNRLCPPIHRVIPYTGCTATALAIVMHYNRWPERGTGVLPSYISASEQVQIDSIPLGHAYDWDNMLMEYNFGEYTEAESEAVATLMRDCAVGLQSDFGTLGSSGTGAYAMDIPALLVNHFGYDRSCHFATRDNYNLSDWIQLMRNELDHQRLVLYGGQSAYGGHAFVLDGYNSDNYFSVNWGWSGVSNGYFLLTALNPEDQGAGGFEGGYNSYQQAIVNIQKDAGGSYVKELSLMNYFSQNESANGLEIIEGEPVQNEPFTLKIGFLYNSGEVDFDGDALIALADREGHIVEELIGVSFADSPLQPLTGYIFSETPTITVPVLAGYRIRTYYRTPEDQTWKLIRANHDDGCVWDLLVADEYSIEESTKLTYSKTDRIIRLEVKDGVSATLQAADGADHSDLCRQEGNSISIDTSGLAGGRYVLTLKKGGETKTVTFALPDAQ